MVQKTDPQDYFDMMSQAWQAPAMYWQTVASIMNMRAQAASALTQSATATLANLPQSQSWPALVGQWSSWHGQTVCILTELELNTWQHRQHLMRSLSSLAMCAVPSSQPTSSSSAAPSTPAPVAVTKEPAKVPQPVAAVATPRPTVTPAPIAQAQASAPVTPVSHPAPPTLTEVPAVKAAPVQAPIQAVAPEPTVTAPVATPTQPTSQPLPFATPLTPTISRTGDAAVVRSGNGASIVAASATRRSVIARRNQRKSRLARAR